MEGGRLGCWMRLLWGVYRRSPTWTWQIILRFFLIVDPGSELWRFWSFQEWCIRRRCLDRPQRQFRIHWYLPRGEVGGLRPLLWTNWHYILQWPLQKLAVAWTGNHEGQKIQRCMVRPMVRKPHARWWTHQDYRLKIQINFRSLSGPGERSVLVYSLEAHIKHANAMTYYISV
jgi:hypothetical protein